MWRRGRWSRVERWFGISLPWKKHVVKTKMIKCFKSGLYQPLERSMKKRKWLNVLSLHRTSLVGTEWRSIVIRRYGINLCSSLLFLSRNHFTTFLNKNRVSFLLPVYNIYCWSSTVMVHVGYHLTFQHNELFHLPYMAVAEISLRISLQVRPEELFLLLKYIINLSLILCSYY